MFFSLKEYFIRLIADILEKSVISPQKTIYRLNRKVSSKDKVIRELEEENKQLYWINHKLQTNYMPVSKKKRNKIFKRDGYQCLKCGTRKDLTIDHITPRSKGGSNELKNLQTLCRNCNIKKGIEEENYKNYVRPLKKN
ncbi:HNH endonuclease [Methanobrevibacter arboriphilus]|nr:HNH endonuclease [Methanobrevibacter arboriphilus]